MSGGSPSGGGGGGGGSVAFIGARAYNSADQSAGTAVWKTLAFNLEDFDTDDIHNNATNNSRLTCKTAGKYLIGGVVRWSPNATGIRSARIYLNGATVIAEVTDVNAGGADDIALDVQTVYDLAANDYVELQAFQNSGGNLNVEAPSHFWMVKVGD